MPDSNAPPIKIRDQFRFHSVALISLITAIVGVSFNIVQTRWIEENATKRDATFETLLALGELQEIVHFAHFKGDQEAGDPIAGWSRVLMVNDLAMLLQPENSNHCRNLKAVWQNHFDTLDEPDSEKAISEAIRLAREETLTVLQTL